MAILAIPFFVFASSAYSAVISFPSNITSAPSPDKRMALISRDSDAEPHHTLFLKKPNGDVRNILDFNRSVTVTWRPDSSAFYVNDHAESNETNCLVFMQSSMQGIDVSMLLRRIISNYSHAYVTCTKWNRGTASVMVVAYDPITDSHKPRNLRRRYTLDVKQAKILGLR